MAHGGAGAVVHQPLAVALADEIRGHAARTLHASRIPHRPAPVLPRAQGAAHLLADQRAQGRHAGLWRAALAELLELKLHQRHHRHRGQGFAFPGDGRQRRGRVLPGLPLLRQLGRERQGGGHADHVHPAGDDLLGHGPAADAARDQDGHGGHGADVARKFGKVGLARQRAAIARLALHGGGFVAAAGKLHQVHAQRVEHLHHGAGVVSAEAAALKVRRVELDSHRKAGRHRCAHGLDGLQQQAGAVFQRAAPGIAALVGQRREELAQQIAVRGVDLHAGEARLLGQLRGVGKALDHVLNVRRRHGLRRGEVLGEFAHVQRNGRRRPGWRAFGGQGG